MWLPIDFEGATDGVPWILLQRDVAPPYKVLWSYLVTLLTPMLWFVFDP